MTTTSLQPENLSIVNPLDFKDHRAGTVIAAGNHDMVVFHPGLHKGAALKGSIDIVADTVPGLGAEAVGNLHGNVF